MGEILNWLALALAGLLVVAVAVAGWEHLRRPVLARSPVDAAWSSGTALAPVTVDLPLDTLPQGASNAEEPQASRTMMSLALTRAAVQARKGRDATPWLDTQPRVALGLLEEAETAPAAAPAAPSVADPRPAGTSDAGPRTAPGALPAPSVPAERTAAR